MQQSYRDGPGFHSRGSKSNDNNRSLPNSGGPESQELGILQLDLAEDPCRGSSFHPGDAEIIIKRFLAQSRAARTRAGRTVTQVLRIKMATGAIPTAHGGESHRRVCLTSTSSQLNSAHLSARWVIPSTMTTQIQTELHYNDWGLKLHLLS